MATEVNGGLIAQFFQGVFGDVTKGFVQVGDITTRDVGEIIAEVRDYQGTAEVFLTTYAEGGGLCERVGVCTMLGPDETPPITPTLVLVNGDLRAALWLIDEPLDLRLGTSCEKLDAVAHLFEGEEIERAYVVPLPGVGGWEMLPGSGEAYSVDEIHDAFLAPPEPVEEVVTKLNDAAIYGALDPALLDREIEIGVSKAGRRTQPGRWRNSVTKLGAFIGSLSKHEAGDKDGMCFLGGAVIEGERKATSIRHMDLLVLDLDTGEDIAAVRARLGRLGLFGVIYTTHSHLKPISDINKDALLRWIGEKREPTAVDAVNYLRDVKRYQASVLVGAELAGTEHTKEGVKVLVRHQPMPKFRVLLVLKERFVFAERAMSPKDAVIEWKERYAGTSKLLGAFFDRSCVDPSRLFYTPRHPVGNDKYSIEVIAGGVLDLDKVQRITSHDLKTESLSAFERAALEVNGGITEYATPNLKYFFAKYATRFEVEDFLLEADGDGDRGPRPNGPGRTHRCPNDDAHSNAGDEEDVGFFCVNASDGDGAVAHCQHDSCATLDRMNFVDIVCARAGIDDALLLRKWCAEVEEDDDDVEGDEEKEEEEKEQELTPFKNKGEAKRAVTNLPKEDREAAIALARRLGASNLGPSEVSGFVTDISKKSGIGIQSLKAEVKIGKGEHAKANGVSEIDEETLEEISKFNRQFALVQAVGKHRILMEPKSPGEVPTLLEIEGWKVKHSNNCVVQMVGDEAKKVPVSKLWLEWPGRRDYDGVVFEPAIVTPKHYNMWRGWPIIGRKGDWGLLHSHIRDNICQDNEENYQWLMTWLAQMFQQPGVKLGSAVALQGKKGTGKSKLFDWVRTAMGPYATKVAHRNHVTGNFNGHQAGKIFITCEEAFWAGDIAAGGILKDMVTSKTMMLEKKGLDAMEVSNYARLAFVSNDRWIVPAGLEDERRFFVLKCGEKRRQDIPFFSAIDRQMNAGGLEGMIFDLMNWIPAHNDWDALREPPKTEWLISQALEGLDFAERFFIQLINDGGINQKPRVEEDIVLNEDSESEIEVQVIRDNFEHFVGRDNRARHRVGNYSYLIEAMEDWLGARKKRVTVGGKREQCFIIPPLKTVRQMVREKKGNVLDAEDEIA